MELIVDDIHRYHGWHGSHGACRIRVFREAGRPPIILCSQPPEMGGTSITNLAEYLAAEVVDKYVPDCETTARFGATLAAPPFLWIEHYPDQPQLEENCAFVRFADYCIERLPAGYWPGLRAKLGQPTWRHVRESAVAALLGRSLADEGRRRRRGGPGAQRPGPRVPAWRACRVGCRWRVRMAGGPTWRRQPAGEVAWCRREPHRSHSGGT